MYIQIDGRSLDDPKAFHVTIFDNTKTGKDCNVKLNQNVNKVFNRFIRNAGWVTLNEEGPLLQCQIPDESLVCGRFKHVRVTTSNGADGYHGKVCAILTPEPNYAPRMLYALRGSTCNRTFELKTIADQSKLTYVTHVNCQSL